MAADMAVKGSDFDTKVLGAEKPVLVDFWAEWCGPCKALGPTVEAIAADMKDTIDVYKLDVDSDGDIASRYGIMGIPVLMLFKGGEMVEQIVGNVPRPKIEEMIKRHI